MKRIITTLEVHQGEKIPKWYGIAYHDFTGHVAYCYPIPFNFFVGWAVKFWFFLKQGVRPSGYLKTFFSIVRSREEEAYSKGFQQGVEAGKREVLDTFEDEIKERERKARARL